MFDFLRKNRDTPFQKWLLNNQKIEVNRVHQGAKMLLAYAAGFVPRKPKMEKAYVERFCNDATIIEIAVFFLAHFEYAANAVGKDVLLVKVMHYYLTAFKQAQLGDYSKLIIDRLTFYESAALKNENAYNETLELLEKLIIDTQNFKRHRLLFEDSFIPYSSNFVMDMRFKSHLNNYFKEVMGGVIAEYDKILAG